MASNSEIEKIVTDILSNAPPGEFVEVVKDIRRIIPDESLLDSIAPKILSDWNTKQLLVVEDNGQKSIICKQAEKGNNEYIDPVNNKVFSFDHWRYKIIDSRQISGDLPKENEEYRVALQKALDNYAKEYYPKGVAVVFPSSSKGKLDIIISSSDFRGANYSNGKWRSEWSVKIGSSAELEGRIRIQVHYYEDGNVQMKTDKTKKLKATVAGSADATAKNIITQIQECEANFHSELTTIFRTMNDNTFKALRRQLPVSKTKINWEAYKGTKMLGK